MTASSANPPASSSDLIGGEPRAGVPTQESRAASSHYLPWFDLLRAACAIAVLLSHEGLFGWDQAGNFAVQIFFALSGWLIGGILIDLKPQDMSRFYFNRSIRIWIPYFLTAFLLLSISVLRQPITPKWIEIVIYKITFVYNLFGPPQLAQFANAMPEKGTLNHFWSVNAEEQFYLLAPLLLVWGRRFGGQSILLWLAIGLAALVFDTYASIVFGVIAALVVERFGPVHRSLVGRIVAASVLVVCIAGFHLFGTSYFQIAPPAALCIVLLAAVPGPRFRYGEILGGMSYPLYLNQWIGGYLFNFIARGTPPLVHHTLAVTFNIALAMAMYWWIDRRLLDQRARWFTSRRGRVITTIAYVSVCVGVVFGLYMTRWR